MSNEIPISLKYNNNLLWLGEARPYAQSAETH